MDGMAFRSFRLCVYTFELICTAFCTPLMAKDKKNQMESYTVAKRKTDCDRCCNTFPLIHTHTHLTLANLWGKNTISAARWPIRNRTTSATSYVILIFFYILRSILGSDWFHTTYLLGVEDIVANWTDKLKHALHLPWTRRQRESWLPFHVLGFSCT